MMERHGMAGCRSTGYFTDQDAAASFMEKARPGALAVKPVGLTGGKGVRIMGEHVDREGAVGYVGDLQARSW